MQYTRRKEKKIEKYYKIPHKRRGEHEVKWRCHCIAKGNDPSPKNTTLDTFSAKCFSLFDYCKPLLFRCRFTFGNFATSIFFLPKLNLHLNFSSGLAACQKCLDPSRATEIFSVPKRRIFALPKIVRYRNKSGLQYSSVEEAIHVLKLMLARNCWGTFHFGPSARGLVWLLC